MKFSEKIKAVRVSRGLTQADIAKELYVSRQAVSKWENGLNEPDIMSIVQLSDILGVTLDELLREDLPLVKKMAKKERSYKKLILALIILSTAFVLLLCSISLGSLLAQEAAFGTKIL